MANIDGNKDDSLIEFHGGSRWGLLCVPADVVNTQGWTAPFLDNDGNLINGGKGETATESTASKAGVKALLSKIGESILVPQTLKRAQDVFFNTALGTGSTFNYSALYNYRREWVSQDRKYCTTTEQDLIKVNGKYQGNPSSLYSKKLFAFVRTVAGVKKVFAVCADGTYKMRCFQKDLLGSLTSWVSVGGDYDLRAPTGDTSGSLLIDYSGRLHHADINASGTVVTVWWDDGSQYFTGMLDIDTATGAVTYVPSQKPVMSVHTVRTDAAGTSQGDTSLTVSGAFQLAVEYDGDTKVFTTVDVSITQHDIWERTISFTGVETDPAGKTQTSHYERTNTLLVNNVFRYRTFEKTITNIAFNHTSSGDLTKNVKQDPETLNRISESETFSTNAQGSATVSSALMIYWGRGLFLYEECAPWTWTGEVTGSEVALHRTIQQDTSRSAVDHSLKLERPGHPAIELLAFTEPVSPYSSTNESDIVVVNFDDAVSADSSYDQSSTGFALQDAITFSNPFAPHDGYIVPGGTPSLVDSAIGDGSAGALASELSFRTFPHTMSPVGLQKTYLSSSITAFEVMNERSVGDFTMASFRKPILVGTAEAPGIDYSADEYVNYCTDPDLLAKYLSTGEFFVLKHLKFI